MADTAVNERMEWLRGVLGRFERPLLVYARGLTGNIESAREVVQDTFLRLCARNQAELDGHVGQWLFTTCRNRAFDVRRKERRMRLVLKEPPPGNRVGGIDPAVKLEVDETGERIRRVLEGLPESQREVVLLRFQGSLSYKEIAAVTGLSVSNVGFLLHTAIKTIRERMSEQS